MNMKKRRLPKHTHSDTRLSDSLRQQRARVPDTHASEFQNEVRRQAAMLRGAPEEVEALDFIGAVADLNDGAG